MTMRTEKCKKVFTLIGAHFLTAPSSFMWNYGNLSAYMESYFRMYCYPHCVDGDSQWIINLYSACFCPGLYLSGPICRYLGYRWAGIFSMLICNAGLLSSAFVMKESVIGTAMLMGFVNGIGMGASLCTAFMYVNAWAGKNKGLFVATVTSAPTILSILQNQIITAYVNPDNLKPDVHIGPKTYFSDISLLKRVPKVVLMLALMTLGLQVLGNLMLSPPTQDNQPDEGESVKNGDVDRFSLAEKVDDHLQKISPSCDQDTESSLIIGKATSHYLSTKGAEHNSQTTPCLQDGPSDKKPFFTPTRDSPEDIKANESSPVEKLPRSYTPLEAVRTGSFKAIWLFIVALMYGLILKNNYYKQFGQVYIENDRFLTLVGSLIPVTASIARVAFGSMMDRHILSVQDCMVITLSANAVLCAFWWFLPQVSSIGYMFFILCLASVHSVTYTLAATGSLLLLGPDHFATNFALVYTSATVTSIVTAFTVTPVLRAFGWFGLFASCGILSAIVLAFAVVIRMNEKKPEAKAL